MRQKKNNWVIQIIIAAGIAIFTMAMPMRQLQAESGKEAALEKFSRIKVAVLYENITDGISMGRSVEDTIRLLKETQADFIFRGFWKWEPVVDSPDCIPDELFALTEDRGLNRSTTVARLRQSGKYYQSLKNWISAIKKEMPQILFCGAIPAQQLCRVELDPITGRVFNPDQTWEMALDPQKWNIIHNGQAVTKEQFQAKISGIRPGKNRTADPRKSSAYFPDITNPDVQQLLLSWAKKQIDCGADAIWIDMLYAQAKLIALATQEPNHPGVKESIAAAKKIIDGIHDYGESKGKYIYVGTWGQSLSDLGVACTPVDLDFVTFTPKPDEIINNELDEEKWKTKVRQVRQDYGYIPIFSFIDWSNDVSPTVTFSQQLSQEQQSNLLKSFDSSFTVLGVNFVYPLHGGFMGQSSEIQSFGKFKVYDSLAPEFQAYETIKELACTKSNP